MRFNSLTLIALGIIFFTGCSEKVKIDYSDFKSSNYKFARGKDEIGKLDKHMSDSFDSIIKKYSQKYSVDAKLIKAIIKKESNFNPKAVNSSSGATGLMQIKPETAGADVYQKIFKKSGEPSRSQLKNPDRNIEIGTAYFRVLEKYLGKIENKDSLEYCLIASFNSGAGAVLKVFHSDRAKAKKLINDLTSKEVYHILTTKHPRAETRDYVKKVLAYKEIVKI